MRAASALLPTPLLQAKRNAFLAVVLKGSEASVPMGIQRSGRAPAGGADAARPVPSRLPARTVTRYR